MSEASSIAAPDSNHSVSTDTEESFLIRQINKSQLFNNSNSNSSSSGSSNSRKQRRSFFRESYIDETGANKSFSVYQDVINETSDESRDVDLSGLSSLDLKLVGNNNSILGELDGNKSVSRAGSVKDNDPRRNRTIKRNDSRRLSQKSGSNEPFMIPNSSQLNISSQNISSQNLSSLSDFSLLQQRINNSSFDSTQPIRIPTPDQPAPGPPISQQRSITTSNVVVSRPSVTEEDEIPKIYAAYAQSERVEEPQQQLQSQPKLPQSTSMSSIPSFPQRTNFNLKQPSKKQSQSTLSSTKSVSSTKRSIMEYESSRKRSPGLPHNLLIHSNDSQGSSVGAGEVKIQNVHGVARRGLGFSIVGITPSIHSPVSASDQQLVDDMGNPRYSERKRNLELQDLRNQQYNKMFKMKSEPTQYDHDQDFQKENHSESSSDSGDSYDYYVHDDELLQKIHHYRNQRPYDLSRKSDTIAWLVFCISFLIPPLFFFLGFGILDQFIGHTSTTVKKLGLIVGFLILLISLACIGIGFGVGLTSL